MDLEVFPIDNAELGDTLETGGADLAITVGMPSAPGVRTISPPSMRRSTRRSSDIVSGIVRISL